MPSELEVVGINIRKYKVYVYHNRLVINDFQHLLQAYFYDHKYI